MKTAKSDRSKKKSIKAFLNWCFLLLLFFSCNQDFNLFKKKKINFNVNNSKDYSFSVAGHSYGAHKGKNLGLYPKFLNKLNTSKKTDFMILTGDIVRKSKKASWESIESELKEIGTPTFYVMGNHDKSDFARALFEKKFHGTYYSFSIGRDQFIALDLTKDGKSLPEEQLQFLKKTITKDAGNIFIFMHEMIWNGGNERYKNIKANGRSRYARLNNDSNFWSEIVPILNEFKNKQIFVFAGDVAGRPDTIAAFYDKLDNIHLIASGMGEVQEENYLEVHVKDGRVSFELISLNDSIKLKRLEEYTVEYLESI